MQTLTVRTTDGAELAVQLAGPDTAPPLLLLPGQANSHRWWDGLRGPFAERFRTITFDYRGTGATRSPLAEPWSTASFAADADAVLAALGHEQAYVYGTSMGGRVAQMLALDFPERVSRLVLACTSPGGARATERDQSVRRALGQRDPAARRAVLLDLMYTPAWAAEHGDRSTLLGDPGLSIEAAGRHLRASARHDAGDRLGEISCPTLVLHGDDDRMVPTVNAEVIGSLIPDAQVMLTTGGRHGFFDEFSAAVTADVLRFLMIGD